MTRRSRGSGKQAKAGGGKAATPKRGAAPKLRHPTSPTAAQETELARRTRERDEALEREKASAKVLRIISTSPGELKPIFQAMLENAVRICEAFFGNLYLRDAEQQSRLS
jgi:two-component system, NtrC family, sensor kinase